MIRTAILIDGAFYRKRAYHLYGDKTPKERADELEWYCKRHIREEKKDDCSLYRVFYYDCPPMDKKVYHPFLKRQIDFGKTADYEWATAFFKELTHKRKFALRMGRLAEEQALFNIKPAAMKKLLNGSVSIDALTERDFALDVKQKGVDMRIGIDSGDSDFVPASKQARREGIDFILDPMRSPIKDDLFEHIDGMRTKAPKISAD
jgi:uncharacterized LabA/DUF88 family protein